MIIFKYSILLLLLMSIAQIFLYFPIMDSLAGGLIVAGIWLFIIERFSFVKLKFEVL